MDVIKPDPEARAGISESGPGSYIYQALKIRKEIAKPQDLVDVKVKFVGHPLRNKSIESDSEAKAEIVEHTRGGPRGPTRTRGP